MENKTEMINNVAVKIYEKCNIDLNKLARNIFFCLYFIVADKYKLFLHNMTYRYNKQPNTTFYNELL